MVGMTSIHSVRNWRDALEAAEGAEFDPIDAREGTPGVVGEMAAWLCDEVQGRDGLMGTAEGIKAESAETVTEEVIHAAIDALEGQMRDPFTPADLLKVLASYNGTTGDDMRKLAEDYADENGYKLVGLTTDNEYKKWFMENCVSPGDACGETQSGGDLMWFNKNHW